MKFILAVVLYVLALAVFVLFEAQMQNHARLKTIETRLGIDWHESIR